MNWSQSVSIEPRLLVVGPIAPTGGIATYVKDIIGDPGPFKVIPFNTMRPAKTRTSNNTVGYGDVLNAGLLRAAAGILVTAWHAMVFPFWILRYRPGTVLIAGSEYWVFWENSVYLFWAKFLRCRVAMHYLGAFDQFYDGSTPLVRYFIRLVLRRLDVLMVLSRRVESIVSEFVPERNVAVVPSSVNLTAFLTAARSDQEGRVRVLFVGGMDPYRKGIATVLKAASDVISQRPGTRFLLAGGENVLAFRAECRDLGISANVDFLGWVSDKAAMYESADVLVLPSENEGLPYVIIEAMASGLPVIASTVGGIPEVVEHGINGYLISPGDSRALAQWIVHLIDSPEERSIIGQRNRKKTESQYSLSATMAKIHTLLATTATSDTVKAGYRAH